MAPAQTFRGFREPHNPKHRAYASACSNCRFAVCGGPLTNGTHCSRARSRQFQVCPILNRLPTPGPVRVFQRPGRAKPRIGAHNIAAACQALHRGCGQPDKSAHGELQGEFQNEYRNDFGYRIDCVPAWWRRLVLGSRPRLTRPVLEPR